MHSQTQNPHLFDEEREGIEDATQNPLDWMRCDALEQESPETHPPSHEAMGDHS